MTPDRLRKVALVLGSLLLMALAYAAARYWQTAADDFTRLKSTADCNLRVGPCQHVVGEGVVTFAIAPRSIPLMRPLRLEVDVEGHRHGAHQSRVPSSCCVRPPDSRRCSLVLGSMIQIYVFRFIKSL